MKIHQAMAVCSFIAEKAVSCSNVNGNDEAVARLAEVALRGWVEGKIELPDISLDTIRESSEEESDKKLEALCRVFARVPEI